MGEEIRNYILAVLTMNPEKLAERRFTDEEITNLVDNLTRAYLLTGRPVNAEEVT